MQFVAATSGPGTEPQGVDLRQELEERLRFETLIADLSSKFVNLPGGEVDREIMDAQRRICDFLDLDLVVLWQILDRARPIFTQTHMYSALAGPMPAGELKHGDFPWVAAQMLANKVVVLASLDQMPPEAASDLHRSRLAGVKSSLCLPLSVGGDSVIGVFALNSVRRAREWPETLVQRLRLVAQIFANALARKHADQELQEREEVNRATFEQAAVGVAHVGIDGRWLRVNDKLCEITGYSRDELLRMTLQEITHAEDLAAYQKHLSAVQAGMAQSFSAEKRYLRKDGSVVFVNAAVSLVRTSAGEPRHFIKVVEDITDRKNVEESFHSSQARLKAGAELAGLGYYEVNFPEETGFVDEKLSEIWGVPAGPQGDLRSAEFWRNHLHPDDRERVLSDRHKLNSGQIEELTIEYRYLHPTQGQKWIHHTARVAERDAAGCAIRAYGVLRDISSRKQVENEAIEMRNELAHISRVSTMGELAASVAHELNQPLGAILANAETAEMVLEQGSPDFGELRDILTAIRKDDERAAQVIRRMRNLLRKSQLDLQPIEINTLVKDVHHLISGEAILRGISLSFDLNPDLPKVFGERVHLQQVLLNIIMNAMDAMAGLPRERRQLFVGTRRGADSEVEMSVIDSGDGINPDKLPHIFEPFYTSKPQGMGMGLSIARTIVGAHRGRIWAKNNASGGAAFFVTLPCSLGPQTEEEGRHENIAS